MCGARGCAYPGLQALGSTAFARFAAAPGCLGGVRTVARCESQLFCGWFCGLATGNPSVSDRSNPKGATDGFPENIVLIYRFYGGDSVGGVGWWPWGGAVHVAE